MFNEFLLTKLFETNSDTGLVIVSQCKTKCLGEFNFDETKDNQSSLLKHSTNQGIAIQNLKLIGSSKRLTLIKRAADDFVQLLIWTPLPVGCGISGGESLIMKLTFHWLSCQPCNL